MRDSDRGGIASDTFLEWQFQTINFQAFAPRYFA